MRKASNTIQYIFNMTGNEKLIPMRLDLGSLASIRSFVNKFMEDFKNLHILINNAGIADIRGILKKTINGFEQHMGVNHLGHFHLTNLLLPLLRKSSPSRIVCLSSTLHLTANLDINNLMLEEPRQANSPKPKPYGNSKLANALFALELSKRLERSGITVYSLCPGLVDTSIFRSEFLVSNAMIKLFMEIFGQSPRKGCETILYCALSRKCANESGKMYRFGQVWEEATKALDPIKAKLLWEKSEELIKNAEKANPRI